MDIEAGKQFLQQYRNKHVVLAPHEDADGLAGGAIIWRFLSGPREIVCPDKGLSIHNEAFTIKLQAHSPEALIIIDQGSRAGAVLPGVPTLIIDHHVPRGIPAGVLVSSYQRIPAESASHICYLLTDEPDELLWLAAIGEIGDFGLQSSFPMIDDAKKRYTQTALLEAVALVNAARRSSHYDWETAFNVLLAAESPKQIATYDVPGANQLQRDRDEVAHELMRAKRARPFFADPWAVIPFSSPCLIHGVVAMSWKNRLKEHYVVAANFGYRQGYVHFSVRSAQQIDLITALRELVPEGMPGEWAFGHHGATGGALTVRDFTLLLNRMGFSLEMISEIQYAAQRKHAA
ncbi:MAG TPA: hypothetical protein VHV83_09035 [Armatimonadota bacterium]|nr:hypothetical protein [Armatimonadota bacterium]